MLGRLKQEDCFNGDDAENMLKTHVPSSLTTCTLCLLHVRFPAGVLFLDIVSINSERCFESGLSELFSSRSRRYSRIVELWEGGSGLLIQQTQVQGFSGSTALSTQINLIQDCTTLPGISQALPSHLQRWKGPILW